MFATPAPPLTPATTQPVKTLATISGMAEQRLWHSTLDRMEADTALSVPPATLQRIRSYITDGVTLDILTPPECIVHSNTPSVALNADVVRTRIAEYMAFEALVPLPADHPLPYGIQPLHVIIKPDRKPRLVVDLSRNLNDNLRYEYFTYSTVRSAVEQSSPDCWYSKLDLSNCFLSFPLHPSVYPHFVFSFEDQLYQFTRMPFGLSSAPRICTELLSVVAYYLGFAGVEELVRYLDDFLLIDITAAASSRSLATALTAFSAFGLVVNPSKTEGPAQRMSFLGVLLDSTTQTLACTPQRVEELLTILQASVSSKRILLSALATLIGKLQFAAQVLPGFRPYIHHLQSLLQSGSAKALHRHRHDSERRRACALHHMRVRTNAAFRADVHFWLSHLRGWNGSAHWRTIQSAPFVFASDASLQGFGFYLEAAPPLTDTTGWPRSLQLGSGFLGVYSPADAQLHAASGQINWCEVFAMYAALSTYRTVLRDCCVLFMCDNSAGVHILNKQSTRADGLSGVLRAIFAIAMECNISIYAQHRPGEENVLADFLSRPEHHHHAANVVDMWRAAHPLSADQLCHVSVVYSQQFSSALGRSTTTPSSPTDSPRTQCERTAHRRGTSSPSAGGPPSTSPLRSLRWTSPSSLPSTPVHTNSPQSPGSSPPSLSTPNASGVRHTSYHAASTSSRTSPAFATTTATPPSAHRRRRCPWRT